MDLWFLQAGAQRKRAARRRPITERSSLDSLVEGDARAEYAAEGLDPSLAFTLKLARALLAYALPAHRVEDALERLADALGFDIDAVCTPTSLVVTMRDAAQLRTCVVRVEPAGADLERLCALHDLIGRVERRELSPGDAAQRVDQILLRPRPLGALVSIAALALTSAAAAVLLGGAGLDVPVAAALGALVGGLEALSQRVGGLRRLLPAVAAFAVTLLGAAAAAYGLHVRPAVLLLAAIVVLLPGLTVTTATIELATANLVAGTSRLMGGGVTFLQLAFGVALARKAAVLLPAPPPAPASVAASAVGTLAATASAALGLALILRVRRRDWPWAMLAVGIALVGARVGGALLGAELGAFAGAVLVSAAANVCARLMDQPASLMVVPGILFLVPGSLGFLSVRSLLENDVPGAVATGFRMFLVAMALAAGTLVATAAVPPRRAL